MNKEWSELNKSVQICLKKEATFFKGINILLELRERLADTLISLSNELKREDFNAMPFINANGYHNKTIAYSIWHIFRIEDIVTHSLINNDEQIFFSKGYQKHIHSPIITTGNELVKQQIADFSKQLDLIELYNYAKEVKISTEEILKNLSFENIKIRISLFIYIS